ncbi:MAG: hypothetical protein ACRD59_16120 [Candidatus Acidiferrales bacterium]
MDRRKQGAMRGGLFFAAVAACALLTGLSIPLLYAQDAGLKQGVSELKESMAKNKQAIAQYTWNETVTISLKGQEKKQQHYQVQMGPDGKPQKTPLDSAQASQPQASGGRGGRLRQRVVEKKKEEYEEYAERMKALAEQYVPPDKDLIQAAYAKGNISMTPGPGGMKLVIRNYVKQGDSMTLTINKEQKQLQSIQISSYMDGPSDGMNLTVEFAKLPDGTNHVSSTTTEGVAKQMTVATQNSNYQKR